MWKQNMRDDSTLCVKTHMEPILGNVFLKLHYEHYELKIP
jgi:hypothetical protein